MKPVSADLQINSSWLIPVIPENSVFSNCSIIIDKGIILDVIPSNEAQKRYSCKQVVNLENKVVLPGLINAHGHAAMSLLRGYADDYPLHNWLNDHIWPAEGKWVSEEFVRDGTELAIAEMIRSGTTCFTDQYFFPEQVAEAARRSGMRCQVSFPIFDFPSAWGSGGDEYIHKGLELHDDYRNSELIKIAFAPHAPYSVADNLFEKIAIYANELDAKVHIHLHETQFEVDEALKAGGDRPISRLNKLNILSANTQCVHMVALSDEDIELIGETQSHIIHCPKSNLKLGSGICPVTTLMGKGINVALGTDGAASNNNLDMFSEMQFASLLAKGSTQDPTSLNAHEALRMATINGAKALGINDTTGSIERGKAADIIAVDLDDIGHSPLYNPASSLVYNQSGHRVSHLWVGGNALMEDRKLLTLNTNELSEKSRLWQQKIGR